MSQVSFPNECYYKQQEKAMSNMSHLSHMSYSKDLNAGTSFVELFLVIMIKYLFGYYTIPKP